MAIVTAALCFACGGSGKKFEAALEKYCASKGENERSAAVRLLLEYAKKRQFPAQSVAENGAVYLRDDDAVRFYWPKTFSVDRNRDFHFLAADPLTGSVAFSRKSELALFDGSGDGIFSGNLPGEAEVMALAFAKGGQYILQGNRLLFRAGDGTVTQVLDAPVTGSLPSRATHRALLLKSGDFIAVNCGLPGMYSLSVADVRQKKLLCRDVSNASLRFAFWGESIVYITGASGSWSLMRMNIASRETKSVRRFVALEDIAFAGSYVCVIEKGKPMMGELETDKFYDFPEGCDLSGTAGGDFVMKYNHDSLLLDAAVLYKGMQKIESCK